MESLAKDPYNIIITGVGGQGNVTASRVLGNMLVKDYFVTIGETFGASQRGGSVMSHVRVSAVSVWSPQIPRGKADLIVALEPAEAVRVLGEYGGKGSYVIVNTRPVYPVKVITGEMEYPPLDTIKKAVSDFTEHVWFIDATDAALQLGNPILGNMVMLGAVAGLNVLPLNKKDFEQAVSRIFPEDKVSINLKAFEIGFEMIND
ncbi:MAG: indolepyruvate ferredoxin oxidoreductase [Theionarchaea archaeon DG-70-1]|nr:MAG: indolepyruvate ferredoxin oxidoreductase [Theionarchaea archaeon DG-70-1]